MHARGRACTSPRDRGVIPPASSLDLLDRRVLRSDKSRDACHLFSNEIPRERAPIARRFSAGFRPRERADPAPGPEPARHRIAAAFHARASSGRSGIFPSPSLQPSKTFDRRDTRSNNCTVRKGPEISADRYLIGRIDRRNNGSVLFFFSLRFFFRVAGRTRATH